MIFVFSIFSILFIFKLYLYINIYYLKYVNKIDFYSLLIVRKNFVVILLSIQIFLDKTI